MKHTYSAEPIQLQLVGGKQLRTSGDFVEFDIQVGTSAGIQLHTDKFYILEQDSEHLTMGIKLHNKIVGNDEFLPIRIVNISHFSEDLENPLYNLNDSAPEDSLEDLSVFPMEPLEMMSQCHFNPSFPLLAELKEIVARHGQVLFQAFDQKGMLCTPMHIELQSDLHLRMQPCRFVRSPTLEQLKALVDQFEEQGC